MNTADEDDRGPGRRWGSDRPSSAPPRLKPWDVDAAWNIPDVAPDDPGSTARPLAALVSFHYVRGAIRRRRWRFLAAGVLGLFCSVAFLLATPTLPTATTTLVLAHDQGAEANDAIATDISLLTTRDLAEKTIAQLGLDVTPQQLLGSLTPVSTGSAEILQLSMTGPTEAEAIRRLDSFSRQYLAFRAELVAGQANALIAGYDQRIAELRTKVDQDDKRIRDLTAQNPTATEQISDALADRQRSNGQISDIEQLRQEAVIQRASVKDASGVIDPPAPLPLGRIKRAVLVLASGLIGGLALGFAVVVLQAILSDKLWLRLEVAYALRAPVPVSAREIAPPGLFGRVLRVLPGWRRRLERRSAERQRIGHALAQAVPLGGARTSLAVLCLGNTDEMRFGLIAAASEIMRSGRPALVVDLSEAGSLEWALSRLEELPPEARPEFFRPSVVPSLSRGPADLEAADWDDVALAKARSGVILVLADLDPAVGVDHLRAWTDDVVVAVTAGRSSVELVRTAADLVRSADLSLQGAVLLGAVGDDASSGLVEPEPENVGRTLDVLAAPPPDKASGRSLP